MTSEWIAKNPIIGAVVRNQEGNNSLGIFDDPKRVYWYMFESLGLPSDYFEQLRLTRPPLVFRMSRLV